MDAKYGSIREATEAYRQRPLVNLEVLKDRAAMEALARCTHTAEEIEYARGIILPAMKAVIMEYFDEVQCPTEFREVIIAMGTLCAAEKRADAVMDLMREFFRREL